MLDVLTRTIFWEQTTQEVEPRQGVEKLVNIGARTPHTHTATMTAGKATSAGFTFFLIILSWNWFSPRNPSNSNGGPWCYTTDPDKRWEYCDIPTCPKDPSAPTCRNWGKGQGVDYRGTVSVTQTGAACEKWSEADLGNWGYGEMGKWRWSHNFCRNPNKQDRGPWCYVPGTKDSYYIGRQGWDYCTVPYCEGEQTQTK